MNERQYRRAVVNRRTYNPRPLFAGESIGRVLRSTAQELTRRRNAVEAWARVAAPELAPLAHVSAFHNGVLMIEVTDPTALHYLRHQVGMLRRRLVELLPGFQELRFAGRATPVDRQRGQQSSDE